MCPPLRQRLRSVTLNTPMSTLTTTVQDHLLLIGLNRPEKYNAFTLQMLRELAEAYTRLEDDPELWCGLLYAHGDHFTAGLDLGEVGPAVREGQVLFPPELVDPLGLYGRERSKPVVIGMQGYCFTIAIELMLASDICVAQRTATFAQIEVQRGIMPFGGATLRFHQTAGWGNAMRYLLTGDRFDAEEAYRMGLVQELTDDHPLEAARVIAQKICAQAPLAVQASLQSALCARRYGPNAARDELMATTRRLMASEDAAEGLQSFLERRKGNFKGK